MKFIVLLLIAFITSATALSQKLQIDPLLKQKIKTSIQQASQNIVYGILDKQGKAKGDYNIFTGTWEEYEPAWHTGQAINALLDAYSITKNPLLLNTAIKSGNWWISLEIKNPLVLKGYLKAIHGAEIGNYINTTTIGDGTAGLFKLSKVTGNKKYAATATHSGDWMIKNLYLEKEALFYNLVDPISGKILKDSSPHAEHYSDSLIELTEVARPNVEGFPFKDMYVFTGKKIYKNVFLNLCNGLLRYQSENGLWMSFEPNDKNTGRIHPRFNVWNAEALIEAYYLTKEKKYLDAAVKCMRYMQKLQQKNGIIYYTNYTNGQFDDKSVCGSAVSFCGIVWLSLVQLGYSEFEENVEKSLHWVLLTQIPATHPDKNIAGAYFETKYKMAKNGKTTLMARDISTEFGIRFLSACYYYNHKN